MTTSTSAPFVELHTHGEVAASDGDHARTAVADVLRIARDPVLSARVRLTRMPDPAVSCPAVAQVNLDVNGRLIRAQASRATMREAVDAVHDRLRERVRRAARDWESIRGGRPVAEEHEWRHQSIPAEHPPFYPRPAEERRIMRHKSFSLGRMTVDEAALDRDLLGYRFHLFTERGSGLDSVLYDRSDDSGSGLRLSQTEPAPERVITGIVPVTVSPHHPPALSSERAVEHLTLTGWPFVFFRDPGTGRGRVVYHRYDGHHGLIVPAE